MSDNKMIIKEGQKVTITIKRESGNNDFPNKKIEEITVTGVVSGVFQEDWATVYDKNNTHAIIDLR